MESSDHRFCADSRKTLAGRRRCFGSVPTMLSVQRENHPSCGNDFRRRGGSGDGTRPPTTVKNLPSSLLGVMARIRMGLGLLAHLGNVVETLEERAAVAAAPSSFDILADLSLASIGFDAGLGAWKQKLKGSIAWTVLVPARAPDIQRLHHPIHRLQPSASSCEMRLIVPCPSHSHIQTKIEAMASVTLLRHLQPFKMQRRPAHQ